MKTIKQQAEEYSMKYPSEIRNEIAKAWIDGRNSIRKKEELDLYFVEEEYKDVFIYWLNYKKERAAIQADRSRGMLPKAIDPFGR